MQARSVAREKRRKARRRRVFINLTRLFLIAVIVVSILGVLAYSVYYSFSNGLFNISKVSVEGVEILTEDQIVEASKIKTGENIFLVDLNRARYNINEVISAKEIYIRRILPDQIVIQINENDPIGVIKVDDKHYYLDTSGKVMEVTEELGKDDTPIISGFDKYEFSDDGSVSVEKQYKFQNILDMLLLFEQNHLLSELSQISLTPQNDYEIITKKGVLFTVKDLENLQSYFDYIALVIENGETNQDINLYSGSNPIKKNR